MALETLKDVEEIGGFAVGHAEKFYEDEHGSGMKDIGNFINKFVCINHHSNNISFKIQNGPIKENGINGCQVDTLIEAAKLIIEGLNKKFPCRENAVAITKLDEALLWMMKRKIDRERRGVEGKNEK